MSWEPLIDTQEFIYMGDPSMAQISTLCHKHLESSRLAPKTWKTLSCTERSKRTELLWQMGQEGMGREK